MAKNRKDQVEAIERNMPRIFDVESKLTLRTSKLSEIKDWKVGETYRVELEINQLTANELENGEIEAEFEIKSAKDIT